MPEIAYRSDAGESAAVIPSDDNAALLKKVRRWFREDKEHWESWRSEAFEDYAFVAGDQWDDADVRLLKDQLRPVITFDRIDPLIRSVSGEQINNAQQVQYLPREMGDAKANEVLTSAADWFRDQCDADDEESESFWDASICGLGWVETRLNMEDDPEEPAPLIDRVDPLEMIPDKNARKRNLSDARRIFRVRSNIPIDEAREEHPDYADSDLDATWARLSSLGGISDDAEAREYENEDRTTKASDGQTVTIVQCQWWEKRTYFKALDPFTGEMVTLDAAQHEELKQKVAMVAAARPEMMIGALQSVQLRKRVFRQAFIGRTILKVKDSPFPDGFSFNCITGFRDRNKGTFYGLVRGMKDPQRWANKWLSQTLHIMNANAKGGVMIEDGAVEDARKFEESFAKPEAVTWVPDGSLSGPNGARIQPKPVAQLPAGFYQLMELAISSIRDTSGINLEMLGMREAGQAASLEYQRRQAGITILAPLFRSMRRYHRNQGRVLLYLIQNHLSDGRLVRIVGDEGAKYVPLVKQADAKYDIIVDEGPTSPNQKERVWQLVGPKFFELPSEIQIALLDYSPFPSSVVERIKSAAEKSSQGPQAEMAQKMQELGAMLLEAKVLLTKAQAGKAEAEAAQTASEIGRPTGMDGRPDHGVNAMMERYKTDTKAAVEREKIAAKVGTDREWMRNDQMLAEQKAEADAAGKVVEAAIGTMFSPNERTMRP